jgi:hypothetical protein
MSAATDPSPTFMDHHYLNFWLWACLHDAEAYLRASAALHSIFAEMSVAVAMRPAQVLSKWVPKVNAKGISENDCDNAVNKQQHNQ